MFSESLSHVNHPFLRHLHAEKKFFSYKLTPSARPEKLWAKKPYYVSLETGMKSLPEAESELALLGPAHGAPFVPGSGDHFYNLGDGDLTQAAADAIAEYKSRMTPGYALGYYFTADSRRFFYDLDGCRNPETGELTEKAHEAIALFRPAGAYMEVSPSGTGIHIVGSYIGERPAHETKNDEFKLELFTGDRGMAIGTPYEGAGSPDADCTVVLQCLIGLYFPKRTVERLSVDLNTMGDLSAPDIKEGLRYFSSARSEFERAEFWNNAMTKFFFTVGTLVARGVLSEAAAWANVCEVPKVQQYLSEEEWTVTNNWTRCIRDSSDKPWMSPGDQVQLAGFGQAPLPPGASQLPVPPASGSMALTPEERIIANTETQEAVARIFARRMKGQMLYDHTRKVWLKWDAIHWKVDELKCVHNFILNLISELNYTNKASMVTASFCDGVNRHLQSFTEFATTSKEFDRDNYLLNTPAGTIDLRTGKMSQHDPADKITLCTVASPEEEGDGAAFRKFMMEITAGDEEVIRFLQVSLGACLSGAVEDHWLGFWYGVPRAGKNTLGELIEALMGDYARTIPTSTLMSKKFEGHPTEMANLQGIRLAISSECSDGEHWNESRIKQLTGDKTISARWIGGNFFEFERTFKLLVYGNYRPQLRSADEALRARLKIVPFKVSFLNREDRELPERLRSEMGYVLQWLLAGHKQWMDAGKKLPECAAVAAESTDYFEAQSTPQLWLKDCCEILKRDERADLQLHTVVECYRSYKTWKEARGESPISQTRWQPEALHGLETVRTRRGACVRRLRLLPLQHSAVPFPPASPEGETFEEFAARVTSVN